MPSTAVGLGASVETLLGEGGGLHQSSNSRCLVSFGPLITAKSIAFIQLTHMCSLMRLVWPGPVLSRGKDLPSCKNIADYIDCRGRIDVTKFALDHCTQFPTLWILVQKEAAMKSVEIGCEQFFNLSGYVSALKCMQLGLRTYEHLAMMALILPDVYLEKNGLQMNT
jgi:hypothetical protein